MFTGIIEEVGRISEAREGKLVIACSSLQDDLREGDSVAVNGVCLTITRFGSGYICAEIMPVTRRTTTLGSVYSGAKVNLERALRVGDRLGGHFVSGHVDGTERIISVRKEQNAVWMEISLAREFKQLLIPKGSITVDGISLTVADRTDAAFTVSLVGHTRHHTILAGKSPGELVNIECDMIGKYILHSKELEARKHVLSMDTLRENGFAT